MSKHIFNYFSDLSKRHHGLAKTWLLCFLFTIATSTRSGCGGCALCGADVKTTPVRESGNATIDIQNLLSLAPPSGTKTVSVGYSGNLVSGGEGTGETSFSVSRSYEVTQGNINPTPTLERKTLRPGKWEIRVSVVDWSASCQGNINKNKGTRFIFTYGNVNCVSN